MPFDSRPTEFIITEQHMKLLNRMYIGWEDCEFGAPAVDCKRPYGNSYVYGDISEIIGMKKAEDDEFSDEQHDQMRKLHGEMQTVLQILVRHASTGIKVGETYVCEKYSSDWKKR